MHGHAVHRLCCFYLAPQARGFRPLGCHRQHLFFCITRSAGIFEPFGCHNYVAGAAIALPAAVPVDAGNGVIDGDLHQRGSCLEFRDMFGVAMLNKNNFAQCLSPASDSQFHSDFARLFRGGHFLTGGGSFNDNIQYF